MGKIGLTEIFVLLILLSALSVIPTIFYLLTLQNTLKEVSPENRKMKPGQVWLTFIPLFGIVWQFFIVERIAESLKTEFLKRNMPVQEERPGASTGMAYCILTCCALIPFIGIPTSIAALICWIIYWVRINNYKNMILQSKVT